MKVWMPSENSWEPTSSLLVLTFFSSEIFLYSWMISKSLQNWWMNFKWHFSTIASENLHCPSLSDISTNFCRLKLQNLFDIRIVLNIRGRLLEILIWTKINWKWCSLSCDSSSISPIVSLSNFQFVGLSVGLYTVYNALMLLWVL